MYRFGNKNYFFLVKVLIHPNGSVWLCSRDPGHHFFGRLVVVRRHSPEATLCFLSQATGLQEVSNPHKVEVESRSRSRSFAEVRKASLDLVVANGCLSPSRGVHKLAS